MPTRTATSRRPGAPNRPKPSDFRQQFIRLGWDVVDHYQTGWKVVARWLEEEGREDLQADRKAYRQVQALKARFETIVDARSSVVTADFVVAVARISEQSASRAARPTR